VAEQTGVTAISDMRMDLQYLIDRLETMVRAGRRMPVMNKIMMDEQELVDLIDQMRTVLPEEIRYAKHVLREKEQILSDAQAQADDVLRNARQQAEVLIEREGLLKQARQQADDIKRQAHEEAERVQVGADNYVRQVLTDLADSLQRQIASVNKGLDSLK
jgi:vacuolar-type H+-ATPase subunit H